MATTDIERDPITGFGLAGIEFPWIDGINRELYLPRDTIPLISAKDGNDYAILPTREGSAILDRADVATLIDYLQGWLDTRTLTHPTKGEEGSDVRNPGAA